MMYLGRSRRKFSRSDFKDMENLWGEINIEEDKIYFENLIFRVS